MPKLFIAKTIKIDGQFETNNILEALNFLVKIGEITPYHVIMLHDDYRKNEAKGGTTVSGFTSAAFSLEWSTVDERLELL